METAVMDPNALAEVCGRHGVLLLVQFGSTVRGAVHAGSDLDIGAVLACRPESLGAQIDLAVDLQRLFQQEVDLSLINNADPLFLQKILEQCRLLYGSPRRLAELKMYAYKRYQDHRRYLALERAYVARTLRKLAAR